DADKVSAASTGEALGAAPETRWSGQSGVRVCSAEAAWPRQDCPNNSLEARPRLQIVRRESQSGQVNGSDSVRHNVGPHLLQRYGVSFGGPDVEERRCKCGEHQ